MAERVSAYNLAEREGFTYYTTKSLIKIDFPQDGE